jgi:hypothetical protein
MIDTTLDALKTALQSRGFSASSRGEGRASFLFVEHDGKAVEISEHEGRWWVEFWDVSEDEDAAPVRDGFFSLHPIRLLTPRPAGFCIQRGPRRFSGTQPDRPPVSRPAIPSDPAPDQCGHPDRKGGKSVT